MNTLLMHHRIEVAVPFSRKEDDRYVKDIMEAALKRVEDEERRFTQALQVALLIEVNNE